MSLIQNLLADTVLVNTNLSLQSEVGDQVSALRTSALQPHEKYQNIETVLNEETKTFWCYMRPKNKPIVTHALLADLTDMQSSFKAQFAAATDSRALPFSYFVFASRTPGIFSLGGDLDHFAECVRAGDRATIHNYARACVKIIYQNYQAFNLPVITMALVQGDALGGGFETALSFDVIVAERSAKLGLPEILFNLFPGMGAYSFLTRRLDAVRAQKLIMSGKVYTAEELYEMGLVDVLVEDGDGEAAIARYIAKNASKHSAHLGMQQARRRVNPVTWDELRDVVDVWVDAVFRLTDLDLRKMSRLTTAQDRRLAAGAAAGR